MKAYLHDGTELNFPEGTDPGVVQATVRRMIGQEATQNGIGSAAVAPVGGSPPQAPINASEGRDLGREQAIKDSPWYEKAGTAIRGNLAGQVANIVSLAGQGGETNEAVKRMAASDKEASGGVGTAASLATDIAETALPIGKAAALAKSLQAVKGLKYAAPVATAGALNAGQDFLINPAVDTSEGENYASMLKRKSTEAAKAGAIGALTMPVGAAISKTATGLFQASKAAKKLMAEGITPTLKQGAEGRLGKLVGGLTSNISRKPEYRQAEEVVNAIATRAGIVPGKTTTKTLNNGVAQFDKDYGALFDKKRFYFDDDDRAALTAIGRKLHRADSKPTYQGEIQNVIDKFSSSGRLRMGYAQLREHYIDPIQARISQLRNSTSDSDKIAMQGLIAAKDYLEKNVRNVQLAPEELARLKDLDTRYFDFARIKDAAQTGPQAKNSISIQNLLKQYYEVNPATASQGRFTASDILDPAMETLGKEAPSVMYRTLKGGVVGAITSTFPQAMALPASISVLGQTKRGARALFGETAAQKKLKGTIDKIAPYLYTLPADIKGEY